MSTRTDNNRRFIVPIASIIEGDRIRKDYSHVPELANSIKERGLLQPIVITLDNKLIAGGSRLKACRDILKWTEIPVNYFEVLDDVTLRILEVEENVRRKAMTWQERVTAIAEVHNRQAVVKAIAGDRWTQQATGELLGMSQANVAYALELASYIRKGDKEVLGCERLWDAINLLIKRKSDESTKLLAKLTVPTTSLADARKLLSEASLDDTADIFTSASTGPSAGGVASLSDDGEMPNAPTAEAIIIPLSKMCLRQEGDGSSLSVIASLPDASVNHIITDWPYGIDMSTIQQSGGGMDVSATAAEHGVDANKKLQKDFIPHAYRLIKDGGFFITWTDISVWQSNYDDLIAAGFKVQPWPLVWYKTHRCQNMAASYNFTKNYEIAIVARKGGATLIAPQDSSVFMGATDDEARSLGHPFAKPTKLWHWLFQAVTIKGQLVLDPFAGAGSSTLAAIQYGLQPLAIEVNETHHARLVVNVSEWYRKTLKNVQFI